MISLCGQRQELGKALTLVADMRGRGITPNIHTYTALINTCIRSGDFTLALDVFKTLEVHAPTNLQNSLYCKKGAYIPGATAPVASCLLMNQATPSTEAFNATYF